MFRYTTKLYWVLEDDRVHISELMFDLFAQRKEDMKNSFIEVHYCFVNNYSITSPRHSEKCCGP